MTIKRQAKWFLIPCTVMALTVGNALVSFATTGRAEENGEWVYYNSDGSKATDVFKKFGNNWSYLDSDENMIKNQLVKDDDSYFYVNSAGAMVTNQWRSIENEDASSDEPDEWWYYFQSNGKAVKKPGNSDNMKFVALPTSTGQAKFTFDDEGRVLYEWIDESGKMLTGDDAWKGGIYYCNDNDDSRIATGWEYITAVNDEDDDGEGDGYWFYFSTNGRKTADNDSKKINDRRYRFGENGATHSEWCNNPGTTSSSTVNKYYNTEEKCWMPTDWFKTVPSKDVDPEAHDNDEVHWFYAESNGSLVTIQIKKVNGQYYRFDVNEKMLQGLYRIEFEENGGAIRSAEEIEDMDELPNGDEDGVFVYCFSDSPKEDAMKTGAMTMEVDGDKYYYSFEKSDNRGRAGTNGIDGGSIYVKERRLEAEEDTKYQPVTYEDETYLISTSGKLVGSKKNVKDSDDVYYKTDSEGRILNSGAKKLD